MKNFLPFFFLSIAILASCYPSAPTSPVITTLATNITITQTPNVSTAITLSPELGWFIFFQHEFEDGFWHKGRNWYKIIVDCSAINYLPSIEGKRMGFTIDENQTFFQGGIVELTYNSILLRYDGMGVLASFNPKQKSKIIFGFESLNFTQASEAAEKCNVQAIINDSLTLNLSPMNPTLERQSGVYSSKP